MAMATSLSPEHGVTSFAPDPMDTNTRFTTKPTKGRHPHKPAQPTFGQPADDAIAEQYQHQGAMLPAWTPVSTR